jgi:hypothetical protein
MSEHTPGPWRMREGWRVVGGNGRRRVCYMDSHAYMSDGVPMLTTQDQANMELILAAPEQQAKIDALLAACKAALDLLEGRGVSAGYVEDAKITVMRQLCAAIAKAEGRPS